MAEKLFIGYYNEVHMFVTGSNEGLEHELRDTFSFFIPGFRYMPAYKRGSWDGKIRLYNQQTKLVYVGLLQRIIQFAKDRDYDVEVDPKIPSSTNWTREQLQSAIDSLELTLTPYDYQFQAVLDALNAERKTILIPTGGGKSLCIYLLARLLNVKTLIIAPTTSLLHQMQGDFKNYGYDEDCHLIYSGRDKNFDEMIGISTWQSIFKMPRTWFQQFGCVIVDEVHGAKAKSLTGILEKMTNTKYRFGTTGTLDGTEANELVIEGLLGAVSRVVTTDNLIKKEVLADFSVNCILLKWDDKACQVVSQYTYQEEVDWIVNNEKRNKIITQMVVNKPGNNLVLVNFVDKHAKHLLEMLQKATDRPIYYIHGGVPADVRDGYRAQIENETDAIILATTKAFATGTNIKRLNNIYFTHPSKSRITTLQAIGRVLRRSNEKTSACLYDIVDDLSYQKKQNFSMLHFYERLKIYVAERFPYKIKKYGYRKDTNE